MMVISERALASEIPVRVPSAGNCRYTFQPARNSAPSSAAPRMILIIVIDRHVSIRRSGSSDGLNPKLRRSDIFIAPNRYYERLGPRGYRRRLNPAAFLISTWGHL